MVDGTAVAVAGGKLKSRAFGGSSKGSGKVCFWTFPRSALSTALFPADFARELRRRSIPQAAVRAHDVCDRAPPLDHPPRRPDSRCRGAGKIVERGSHAAPYAAEGRYRELYDK